MTTVIQRSFAAGEIAPALYGRVDQVKYATGLRTCRNHIVQRHGGVSNRPGTQYIADVKFPGKKVRLIPFIFNDDQTYILEFGDLYMRVHRLGVQQTIGTVGINDVTSANPAVVTTAAAHGYSTGDHVAISSVGGMTELNNRNFEITVLTTTTFELKFLTGGAVDSTSFGAYTSGGSVSKVFEITTPYVEADLPNLKFVQSADVVTLVHPNYAPRELARTGHTTWTLTEIDFIPNTTHPTGASGSAGGAGSDTYKYKITAVDSDTLEESLPGVEATKVITNISQANPAVVSVASHGYVNGDTVLIEAVDGMTEVNGRRFVVDNVTAGTFELKDEDSTSYTAYSANGTSAREDVTILSAAAPTTSAPHTVTWTAVANVQQYNIYGNVNGVYGFLGSSRTEQFEDTGISADAADVAPVFRNPFFGFGNYPSTVAYHQQRLGFANTNNNPEQALFSRTASFANFTTRIPLRADDAVIFTLAGQKVNEIRNMIDLNGTLVAMTKGGEWSVKGNEAGILVPGEINPVQQTFNGSAELRPLNVGGNALYVQERGSIVRDLLFEFDVDGYRGTDLTVFSVHLVDGFTITDWDYQQTPNSIVWMVRSDGNLLGLTYLREQQLLGWHRHDFTNGTVENVAVVPEGLEDVLYAVIKRDVDVDNDGTTETVRYIERLGSRRIGDDIADSVFVDSYLSRDGTHTGSTTMTLSGGTTWVYTEDLTLTASASFFDSSMVGDEIHLTGSDGTLLKCEITVFTNTTTVTVRASKTVPVSMRNVAISSWGHAVKSVGGLWHLEGQTISAFGDGFVAASANNPEHTAVTVTDGVATFDRNYVKLHVGLPITSDFETLDIDQINGETLIDKKIAVNLVTALVESTRGLFAGIQAPTGSNLVEGLQEFQLANNEGYDDPPALITGPIEVSIETEFTRGGRVFLRQIDPIPCSILAIAPAGFLPIRGT